MAKQSRGKTAPNPMVGALVVDQSGIVVGRGYHPVAGGPHAEVVAIEDADRHGVDLSQCTLVITLEPCGFFGKTPPCLDLILDKKIPRVIVGTQDPNPKVCGQSIQKLRQHGVDVQEGVLESECAKLIRGFASALTLGRPYITLKCATSLDGKIATMGGESKWITSEFSRKEAHRLRSDHDAILVGIGTLLADDPNLTVRHGNESYRMTKVILDSTLRCSPGARVFQSKDSVLIYCSPEADLEKKLALENVGAQVIPIYPYNLKEVVADLAQKGVQDLLVEGGASVLGSFVRETLFDRMVYFMSPQILGDKALDVFQGVSPSTLRESVKLKDVETKMLGGDLVIEGVPDCSPV